jgi:site-specific DNA recombinase
VVHKDVAYPGEHKAIIDQELWNAVQAKLSGDVVRQRRARIESGALLTGLIFDDRGNRMTPTYTVRRGNRYRYYVSRALTHHGRQGTSDVPRVGADDIERLVVEAVARALSRKDLLTDPGSGIWNTETRALLRESVERVIVDGEEGQIVLKRKAGESGTGMAEEDDHDVAATVLTIPLPGARPRARREILLPRNAGAAPRRIDQALMLALAQARSWVRGLRHGEYADTAEIGRRLRLSEPHVRRLLRFAYLAPDMVEAIVEGRQPRSLTVRLLLRGIPLSWSDQRVAFGLSLR